MNETQEDLEVVEPEKSVEEKLAEATGFLAEIASLQKEHAFALRGISMHLSQLAGRVDAVEEFLERVLEGAGEPEVEGE